MGMARAMRLESTPGYMHTDKCAGVSEAIDLYAAEVRSEGEPTPESQEGIVQAFLDMLCLPICTSTYISPSTLSDATSGIANITEGVPPEILEMLVLDMICNLCPPWPLCPESLLQCVIDSTVNESTESTL